MVTLSPVGLATALVANQVSFLATFKEKLCRPFCVDSTVQPSVTITYTTGTPRLVGTTVFVRVKAVISIVTQSGCCNAKIHLYTETFEVAFQGRTTLPSTVTLTSLGRSMEGSNIKCGRACYYTIFDSLVVSIATPAA